jgi:hypothetical protein
VRREDFEATLHRFDRRKGFKVSTARPETNIAVRTTDVCVLASDCAIDDVRSAFENVDGRTNRPSLRFILAHGTSLSLRCELVVDSFDVPVHATDLSVVEMVPTLAFDCLAVLVHDRALEHMQLA